MRTLLRLIRSDWQKVRRTPLLWLHLLLPVLFAGLFLAYAAASLRTDAAMVSGYVQVLAIGFPLVIGIVCAMAAEQEAAAGRCQRLLLAADPKALGLLSKGVVLLALGTAASVLATVLYGAGHALLLPGSPLGLAVFAQAGLILALGNAALYVVHLVLGLRFGKGASIGLGIVGSLLSALLLTGLGEGIWLAVPFGWGGRMVSVWALLRSGTALPAGVLAEANAGFGVAAASLVVSFGLACAWFQRWEGESPKE
ncbi:lantibiotic immunity ABC transporter MutG family permease subunit [Gorillibacterium sp. sgz500922]|uniref:lantibiotic immunity ABC transporter MutG family permease subunit n=1 Tax=Gorillibacterium sp. sgz500922 TaxID=3446694 RepID=UPI003F675AC0